MNVYFMVLRYVLEHLIKIYNVAIMGEFLCVSTYTVNSTMRSVWGFVTQQYSPTLIIWTTSKSWSVETSKKTLDSIVGVQVTTPTPILSCYCRVCVPSYMMFLCHFYPARMRKGWSKRFCLSVPKITRSRVLGIYTCVCVLWAQQISRYRQKTLNCWRWLAC